MIFGDVASGIGGEQNALSPIFGSGDPFDSPTVERLNPGGLADYLRRFTASLDSAIELGFLLNADRHETPEIAAAQFSRIGAT